MYTIFNTVESLINIAKQVIPDISIIEVHGSPTGVSCQIKDNVPTILWDTDFWNYIEQCVFLGDTLPYELENDIKIITEYFYNYNGIQAYHLSKRYSGIPQLQSAFIEHANRFHYSYFQEIYPEAVKVSEFYIEYELAMMTCRLMALYHELGHLVFRRDPVLKKTMEDMTISNVKGFMLDLGDQIYDSLKINNPDRLTNEYVKSILEQLVERNVRYTNLREEMAADLYAVSKTHATMFQAIEPSNSEAASNAILSGIMVFYSFVSNYELFSSFWDSMIPMVLLKKNEVSDSVSDILMAKDDNVVIRSQVYPTILFFVICELDNEKWKADKAQFLPRLLSILHKHNINERWRWRAFESINNPDVYRETLLFANQVDLKKGKYELTVLPKDALLITWISNQYHNCKGLKLLNEEHNPNEALQQFVTSIAISEQYLGHNHRHTARAYNNAVTALLEIFKWTQDAVALSTAKNYSDIAIDIIKDHSLESYNHTAQIYQNAGVVAQLLDDHEKAIELFLIAKKQKNMIAEGQYYFSNALTDQALAMSYLFVGQQAKAKELCERVLDFLNCNDMQDHPLYSETLMMYQFC